MTTERHHPAPAEFKQLIGQISSRRYFILAVLFAAAVFFVGLGSRQLAGGDEPRVAGIAAGILISGNWTEPRLNDRPFLEKPPLYFWADALAMEIFGRTDFAAKLPSAIAAFLGAIAVFFLARGLGMSGFGALLAAVLLSTSAQYWNYGRKCMVDIFLAVFVAFAMGAFWQLCRSEKIKNSMFWFGCFFLSLGGAVLSKGLVGLAIPGSALFFYLVVNELCLEKKIILKYWLYLFCGALLSFIPAALWLGALNEHSGYEAVRTVVWTNNFGRFIGSHAEHVEPFWYYLKKIPEELQPWTVLLPFALWFNIRRLGREKNAPALFLLCWLAIPYLLLMFAAGKRQVYLLPLYPAEILLIANLLDQLYCDKLKLPVRWDYVRPLTKIVAGVFAGALIIGGLFFNGIAAAGQPGVLNIAPVLMVAAGAVAVYCLRRKLAGRTALWLLIGLAVTYISIDTVVRPLKNWRNSYYALFEYCGRQLKTGKKLYLYKPIERESGAALFYLGCNYPQFDFRTAAGPETLVLTNNVYSESFLKAGFEKIAEFRIQGRTYWIMDHE
ncbi:MAG: glycosyltransferase family 39 protein [Victivallaceae bacterium]|nr:glycosyltransferase family 39 protein [Victivallaceae bacterium]